MLGSFLCGFQFDTDRGRLGFLDGPRRREAAAAKPLGKITTKQKPSGVFTGRDNAKFTAMSALPPKADVAEHDWDVRLVPKADISLDPSLVSATEQGGMIPCKFGEGTRPAAG
jgi:hypothetical protein